MHVYVQVKCTNKFLNLTCLRMMGGVMGMMEKFQFIQNWAKAYPLESFPEPHRFEWQQAAALLSEKVISIGSLSASNIRHVITGVKRAVDHGLTGNDPGAIGPQGASA